MLKTLTTKNYKNLLTLFALYTLSSLSEKTMSTSEPTRYMMFNRSNNQFSSLTATKVNGRYIDVIHRHQREVIDKGSNLCDDGSIVPIISSMDQIGNIEPTCVYVNHNGDKKSMNLMTVQQIGTQVYGREVDIYCDSCRRHLFEDEQCYSYDYVFFSKVSMETYELCFNCVSHLLAKLWKNNKKKIIRVLQDLSISKDLAEIIYKLATPTSLPIEPKKKNSTTFYIQWKKPKNITSNFILKKESRFPQYIDPVDANTLNQLLKHFMRKNNGLAQINHDLEEKNNVLEKVNNQLEKKSNSLEHVKNQLEEKNKHLKDDVFILNKQKDWLQKHYKELKKNKTCLHQKHSNIKMHHDNQNNCKKKHIERENILDEKPLSDKNTSTQQPNLDNSLSTSSIVSLTLPGTIALAKCCLNKNKTQDN